MEREGRGEWEKMGRGGEGRGGRREWSICTDLLVPGSPPPSSSSLYNNYDAAVLEHTHCRKIGSISALWRAHCKKINFVLLYWR